MTQNSTIEIKSKVLPALELLLSIKSSFRSCWWFLRPELWVLLVCSRAYQCWMPRWSVPLHNTSCKHCVSRLYEDVTVKVQNIVKNICSHWSRRLSKKWNPEI